MIMAAANSLGPRAAREAALSFTASFDGVYFAFEQSRNPAEQVGCAVRHSRWWFDRPRNRLRRIAELIYPGAIRFSNLAALRSDGSWNIDRLRWRTGDDLLTGDAAASLQSRLQFERHFPHLVIAQAEKASSAVVTAPDSFRYSDASGRDVEVVLDPATRHPVRSVQEIPGAGRLEYVYSDYKQRHGIYLPRRVQLIFAGRLQEDLRLDRTAVAIPPDSLFEPPKDYSVPPNSGAPEARELAEKLFFFENMPGGYHSAIFDAGDHLLLVEAPLSKAYATAQKQVIEQIFPNKPVRYVLVTHHHGDHTGGLGYWIENGAIIVAPPGARIALERQLRSQGVKAPARIEEVSSRRRFGKGRARVDAYSFTSDHAASNLLVSFPEARAVFQGDLFYVPERGAVPPAFPVVQDFIRQLDQAGLSPDLILGVHGRPATGAELRASVAAAPTPLKMAGSQTPYPSCEGSPAAQR